MTQTILDARAKVLTDQAGSLIEQSAVEADKQSDIPNSRQFA